MALIMNDCTFVVEEWLRTLLAPARRTMTLKTPTSFVQPWWSVVQGQQPTLSRAPRATSHTASQKSKAQLIVSGHGLKDHMPTLAQLSGKLFEEHFFCPLVSCSSTQSLHPKNFIKGSLEWLVLPPPKNVSFQGLCMHWHYFSQKQKHTFCPHTWQPL